MCRKLAIWVTLADYILWCRSIWSELHFFKQVKDHLFDWARETKYKYIWKSYSVIKVHFNGLLFKTPNCSTQRSRLRRPISKIRIILLMDAKIWMASLIIMFAVRPICVQDSIFKMSSESPEHWCILINSFVSYKFKRVNSHTNTHMLHIIFADVLIWLEYITWLHGLYSLIHWGQVTHICIGKLTIIGPDNGLSPGGRQAIIWTNAGILLIGPCGTNFSEILIGIPTLSFKKMQFQMSSAKWRLFCLNLNVSRSKMYYHQISWRLEVARLDVIMIILLQNLAGITAALLPRCLSNFRIIEKVQM